MSSCAHKDIHEFVVQNFKAIGSVNRNGFDAIRCATKDRSCECFALQSTCGVQSGEMRMPQYAS
jgi:hypothetical protein